MLHDLSRAKLRTGNTLQLLDLFNISTEFICFTLLCHYISVSTFLTLISSNLIFESNLAGLFQTVSSVQNKKQTMRVTGNQLKCWAAQSPETGAETSVEVI